MPLPPLLPSASTTSRYRLISGGCRAVGSAGRAQGVYHGSTTLALAHAVHESTVETLTPTPSGRRRIASATSRSS